MASQPFKRAFAANQPTCHYFKISHPSTVVVAGLRGEALTGMRSLASVMHRRNVSIGPANSMAHSPTEALSLSRALDRPDSTRHRPGPWSVVGQRLCVVLLALVQLHLTPATARARVGISPSVVICG
jgi:hypothetical protein